jgi:hypothetical protein
MSKKTILSLFLIIVGVRVSLLVIFAYTRSGGKASITMGFLTAAVTSIIVGSILGFSRLLDRTVKRFIDEIYQDIEDDIDDITHSRFTNTIWMIFILVIGLFIFSFFVLRFHKVEAMWGGIPVVVPTFIALAVLTWFLPRTLWFQNQRAYTPIWIFLIPTSGLIITMIAGIGKTENLSLMRAPYAQNKEYNAYQNTGFILQEAAEVGSSGIQFDIPNCDGEECAVLLVIALIVLTFVLIVGSALIPHFWLFNGSILLCIMLLIATHDLQVRRTTPVRGYFPG